MKSILVTGGAGYVGAVLVPKLLSGGYAVRVLDLFLFGETVLPTHPALELVRGDIRDAERVREAVRGMDAVIHLACISNDPSFELDAGLSRGINYDCFEMLVEESRNAAVKRFIYASTSSVYGVSDAPDVTEEHPLVPLTDYNKYKGLCEPLLLKYQADDFVPVIIRPATICGPSPRMRFDLSVNILTNLAVNTGRITVFGGSQKRPNIHIDDVTDLYADLLEIADTKITGETFNVAYENHTIADLAEIVRAVVEHEMPDRRPITIETSPTNDLRSYHVSSAKIAARLGYRPKRTIDDAVMDMCKAFREGRFPDSLTDDRYFNVRMIKVAGLR